MKANPALNRSTSMIFAVALLIVGVSVIGLQAGTAALADAPRLRCSAMGPGFSLFPS
ncbi:hypothetical protein [Luethyella okanaganae]|uniref:Uncharacterized protein n=1 Tax=Luethyella okanaganae TaxID=69372 RepID=A0ABW1VEM7_9MICO